ncbi:lipid-A-disaccharide synthase [Pseudorhizobium tarimense]|uniref:Lipid-A-disaccharide synthase n=1 Tax=Pseudorhizobium tarimense TaxID=1079109 RepID=A0ABV2HAH2_9HYPH|nr:lipid-A-disaccharide synthase [Pseudorhizobium tarimense]MCJ8520544.1 lipid-A-disaccharide synthase [Pseudorhizobium tarimense]
MSDAPLKVAVVAGEVSGDLLGADLVAALKAARSGPIEIVGVGGDALQAEGLRSLFDFSELSIMGLTQVLQRLPQLMRRISQTADAIILGRPDVLVIIDSPDFTHRVAKRVRAALPDLPIIDYVCPSVWAWKEYRARAMVPYIDHVLAVLPFEPPAMERLGGPPTTFVGHRLTSDPAVLKVRALRSQMPVKQPDDRRTIMLLPGSRAAEIRQLLPVFGQTAADFEQRNGPTRFVLPTVPRQEALIREIARSLPVTPEISISAEDKWAAFADADAALAASGTVLLELALCGIPTVSSYKADWLITLMSKRIKIWSAALPNLIADYPLIPEHFNEFVRRGSLLRWAERLSSDTAQRRAMLEGYDLTWLRLQTPVPPGEAAAGIVLKTIEQKKPG